MQPSIGAPATAPARGGRAMQWLAGLFPVFAIAGVTVQYGLMWDAETGPTNMILYLIIPVVLLLLMLLAAQQWWKSGWKNTAVMLYTIPFAIVFTASVFYAAHYALDYRFQVSEHSRLVEELETKARGTITNELNARGGKVPMQGENIDLAAMGYTYSAADNTCTAIAPGGKQEPCPYKFVFKEVNGEKQAALVDKQPWENPFEHGAGPGDIILWLSVFTGSFVIFQKYVADLPGSKPN